MRAAILCGLVLGLCAAGAPLSAEPAISEPDWASKPSGKDFDRAYPSAARKAKLNGEAVLDCSVAPDGALDACSVVSESPKDYGFGEASLAVASKFRMKPEDASRQAGAKVRFLVEFYEAGFTTRTATGEIRTTDWRRKPSAHDLQGVWPAAALKRGVGGKATIDCQVSTVGLLEKCKVKSEEPAGLGFGSAALALSGAFEMQPRLENGTPTKSTVTIPIVFGAAGAGSMTNVGKTFKMLQRPLWDAAPTSADVAALWPRSGAQDLETARVTLTCFPKPDGTLRGCREVLVSPNRGAFRDAAFKLIPKFKLRLSGLEPELLKEIGVTVPIQFLNPATHTQPRALSNAQWARSADFNQVLAVFPEQAVAKGIKQGLGVAQCVAAVGGRLDDCKPLRADPADLGFAEAAVVIARSMQLNAWGEDGLPPDGAVLRLPIRFNLNEPAAKADP
ncbi:TonB family protein [Caulobacter segnis]|uniref:TonB family protein n=1 Tax=Caulobacter segnis TaxID=88688 RepID=UPI002410AD40|nr:TonB family protein [Caulobacter segnis]MDG2521134.1 TonB family protein [Caulobacter segnis]